MNTTGPESELRGADQVSRAYRAANFDEEPPAELDRVILAAARRQRHRPLASYMPPLALAATVVLSISLVLRSGVVNEDAEIFSDQAPPAAAVRTLPISTVRDLEEAVAPEQAAARQNLPVPAAATNAIPEVDRLLPQQPVELRARQMLPETLEAISQDRQAVQPGAVEFLPLTAGTAAAVQIGCADVDRGQPDAWLACISVRLQQGYEEDARRELQAFAETYPDFSLPEEFETLLAP